MESWTESTAHTRLNELIAESLARNFNEVLPHASLIADLGAESIDFLDLQFRVESTFGLTFAEGELWRGELDLDDPAVVGPDGRLTDKAIATLQTLQPGYRWERFPRGITRGDLPLLVTPDTIARVVLRRLSLR